MNQSYTKTQREHLERVKMLPCSVCDSLGPSEAHHIEQDDPYTCIALCTSCHRDPKFGWHGHRFAWKLRKISEVVALAITYRRLIYGV